MTDADPGSDSLWSEIRAVVGRRFVRRAGGLISASAVSQAISLVTFVLVARLYAPESIGVYVVYTSCLTILVPVLMLSNEFAVPNAADGRELRETVGVLFMLGVLAAVTVFSVAAAVRYDQSAALGLACLAMALQRLAGQLNVRFQRFRALAAAQVGAAALFLVLVVTLDNLVLAQVTAVTAVSFAQLLDVLRLPDLRGISGDLRPARFLPILSANARFSWFVAPSQFFNLAAYHLPTILISRFFGAALAAQYGMGLRLAHAPIHLVGNALNTTFHGWLAEAVRDERREDAYRGFTSLRRWLVAGGAVTAIALGLLAPRAFGLVLGPGWEPAARIVQLLAPLYGTMIVLMPLGVAFLVLGRQGTILASQVCYFLISVISMAIAVATANLLIGIAVFSALSLLRFAWLLRSLVTLLLRWRESVPGGERRGPS